ncbi:CsbD family protein [Anabaena sp. UHCC 0187]|uniref:CsbD family protein n=1 Tax=Anabaena sp. UHCC 0187 TaxID=2590018 RepID=UPI001447177F|nr:CsbD family protein [Anabaena sp. UHCC 0187]
MILLQKFRKFFLIISLVLLLGTFTAFAAEDSLAQTQIASMNRVEATTKNIEGKVQEAVGNVTGNKKDQFMGKAKQAESKVRNAVEDIKDASLNQKSKAAIKKMEIKTEKAIDNSIVNPNYLPSGKTDDIRSESRNPANQMKDEIRNTFK